MKTSCRNQLIGKVTAVEQARLSTDVQLLTNGGSTITAMISRDSQESLGIQEGVEVHALVKSSAVVLTDPNSGLKFSARNQLPGKVSRIQTGMVNAEVVIATNDQEHMAATVTNEAVQDLDLKPGKDVLMCFKVSNVILGVAS